MSKLTHSRMYGRWRSMIRRCHDQKDHAYENYGGRGISVCQRWRDSYLNFAEDMGECPDGLTLERIDNNGNYEHSNCRWATVAEQNFNRRAQRGWNRWGYKGIFKKYRKFCAQIQSKGRRYCLGYFPTKEAAAHAYDKKAIELFGSNAVLNFPNAT